MGNVDIVIRNVDEFKRFCANNTFQQHMASLMEQAFDPQFNLTCVYTCVARLTQRHILSQQDGVMLMSQKVDLVHNAILIKLV